MARLQTLGLLSITDGRLMCDIGHVYEAVSHFIGRPAFTYELPMYSRKAAPMVLHAFPAMAGDLTRDWQDVRDAVLLEYGDTVEAPATWAGALADGKGLLTTLDEAVRQARAH